MDSKILKKIDKALVNIEKLVPKELERVRNLVADIRADIRKHYRATAKPKK
jgi:hypothetical protein